MNEKQKIAFEAAMQTLKEKYQGVKTQATRGRSKREIYQDANKFMEEEYAIDFEANNPELKLLSKDRLR
jgi:hypothetical protein